MYDPMLVEAGLDFVVAEKCVRLVPGQAPGQVIPPLDGTVAVGQAVAGTAPG